MNEMEYAICDTDTGAVTATAKVDPAFKPRAGWLRIPDGVSIEHPHEWRVSETGQLLRTADVSLISEQIRQRRNQLLNACDWTQMNDSPADATLWAAYRQKLRDLPALVDYNNVKSLSDVKWPESP